MEKGKTFVDTYGGKIFESYSSLIMSNEVDAIYLPLPPALHYKWAKKALENDKHVFVEKPSTTNYQDSLNLVKLAEERKLVLHENYMFQYHSQISEIKKEVENGKIGKVHSYHARFGFPRRDRNDFRYNKELGRRFIGCWRICNKTCNKVTWRRYYIGVMCHEFL